MDKTIPFAGVALPPMTDQEFKAFGLDEVAYIKAYPVKDGTAWVVHAADGTALAVQKDASAAVDSAHAQDLGVATVH